MSKQLIITVGREFGSGGHAIADILSKKFNIPLYDSNILHEIAGIKNVDVQTYTKYDEVPKNKIFSKTRLGGYSSSPEENIANLQFNYLRAKAEKGESFVVVGRCSETILRGYPGVVSLFILGDKEEKLKRIMKVYNVSKIEADVMMSKQDKKRKSYHNYYCPVKWGDSRNYDISLNSSKLGVERSADFLEGYIKERSK